MTARAPMKEEARPEHVGWGLLTDLFEMAKVDTAFADLYLERARQRVSAELSEARAAVPLPGHGSLRGVRDVVVHTLEPIAARVHGFDGVLVDPFSPGIAGLAGFAERDLPALQAAALKRLVRLCAADPAAVDLYDARREALGALRLQGAPTMPLVAPMLLNPFPREVCDRAGRLGLAPHRVHSMAEEVVARFHPTWQATLGDRSGTTLRLAVTAPRNTEDALRDAAELFTDHAFVTSAGTRYIPWMVAEDVLVEELEEPAPGAEPPASPLLRALELPRRTGLSRKTVEKALRAHGTAVVKELELDPQEYRLVCVPADVYTRLGAKLGWGTRELWTHFDGYMASKERCLMAHVGGDLRFGGLQDFTPVGVDWQSEQLFARFAVVQRRRFDVW